MGILMDNCILGIYPRIDFKAPPAFASQSQMTVTNAVGKHIEQPEMNMNMVRG